MIFSGSARRRSAAARDSHQIGKRKDTDMARGAAKPKPIDGEIGKPDFALAVKIYRDDIKPAQSRVGEFAQEQSTAYKAIKKAAHIQPGAAKSAFKLAEMEESKREDFIRCFVGILETMDAWPKPDLVDAAEGKAKVGQRPKPQLVTVPTGPADDSDLSGEADEMSAVERAKADDAKYFDDGKGDTKQ
jgi:hypothetical protein